MTELFVEVARAAFRIRVYHWEAAVKRYRRAATFGCAVGMVGRATPPGPYVVTGRSRKPDWQAPEWSQYAGEVIPFDDPRNPFSGGFIALGGNPATRGDGVGFHGTKFDPNIGTRASHGCVRMLVPDLERLWDLVPDGSLVIIR